MRVELVLPTSLSFLLVAGVAAAQDAAPTGAPPADAKALVEAPKSGEEAPKIDTPNDETTAMLSAGGQMASGNSQLAAGTVNGKLEIRRGSDGFGASLLGNYGETALPGTDLHVTTENLQGRIRYDRYLLEQVSLFLIDTERHDRFQGLDLRTNLDPGLKYLFVHTDASTIWAEAGYDFQYDIRRRDALAVVDASGNPVLDPVTGLPQMLDKTATDHSSRLFAGFKHAFNKEVTFSTGIEYLQSFVHSQSLRLNYDALFAATVGGGFAVGVGFTARYDHNPLPGKLDLDTATTLSLIYSFSDLPETTK